MKGWMAGWSEEFGVLRLVFVHEVSGVSCCSHGAIARLLAGFIVLAPWLPIRWGVFLIHFFPSSSPLLPTELLDSPSLVLVSQRAFLASFSLEM